MNSVNLRIQSKYGESRTRKNSVFGHFSRSGHFREPKIVCWKTNLLLTLLKQLVPCSIIISLPYLSPLFLCVKFLFAMFLRNVVKALLVTLLVFPCQKISIVLISLVLLLPWLPFSTLRKHLLSSFKRHFTWRASLKRSDSFIIIRFQHVLQEYIFGLFLGFHSLD